MEDILVGKSMVRVVSLGKFQKLIDTGDPGDPAALSALFVVFGCSCYLVDTHLLA